MHLTTHMDCRMNQSGIRKCLVDLTLDVGDVDGDRFVLTQKAIDREISALQGRLKLLGEARKKGGDCCCCGRRERHHNIPAEQLSAWQAEE